MGKDWPDSAVKSDFCPMSTVTNIATKGRRQKKIADFQTYAQIGVGGSGKNLI